MLVIGVVGIVAVELLVLMLGISVPESRLQAMRTLKFEDLHQNVSYLCNTCVVLSMTSFESNDLHFYLRK